MHDSLNKDRSLPEAILDASDNCLLVAREVCRTVLRFVHGDKRFDEIRSVIESFVEDLAGMQADNDRIRRTWTYVPGIDHLATVDRIHHSGACVRTAVTSGDEL